MIYKNSELSAILVWRPRRHFVSPSPGATKAPARKPRAAATPLLVSPEDRARGEQQRADLRPVDHRFGGARAPRRPACRSVGRGAGRAQGERRSGEARRSAGASRPDLHPRQPHVRRGVDDRGLAGLRAGAAPVRAHGEAAETGVVSAQQVEDVEIRRNTAQSEREAARIARGHRAPDAGAHRGARALRRHRQRPQGFGRRHRAGGQGTAEGHRSFQPAFRGLRLRRQHRRSEDRAARVVPHPWLRANASSRASSRA